ncbi:MAG: hypothetical protein LQ341_005326 [Variospora aurantia]|nr:MAG: hypothetical protein LQ341_005326 [Variospora aurantia]
MSALGGRRTTRAASRAASSRAASETPSIVDDGPTNLRSSRAGSAKAKRSTIGNKDTKTYGSKLAAAGAERLAAATATGAVGGIEAALTQSQVPTEEPTGPIQDEHLAALQEEHDGPVSESHARGTSAERLRFPERTSGQNQFPMDPLQEAHLAHGNQPLEGLSVLQKQITLSSSDSFIDRSLSALFRPKHYIALAAFLLLLTLLFADIYRGPLFGSRFDLLKNRRTVANQTVVVPAGLPSIEGRLTALERLISEQARGSDVADKPRPINFFSRVHHVLVIPYLTSPTGRRWLRSGLTDTNESVFREPSAFEKYIYPGYSQIVANPNGPANVFAPWDESDGPSWCAAAGEAKLQLGVSVRGPMTPTELVVEYNPSSLAFDPHMVPAPKEIELWMRVLDDTTRESVYKSVEARYGDTFEQRPLTGAPNALPYGFIPVGRWDYDLHAPEHAQTLRIDVDLQGARTSQLVVRVNSNWANDPFSCLYRLRLHGVPASAR